MHPAGRLTVQNPLVMRRRRRVPGVAVTTATPADLDSLARFLQAQWRGRLFAPQTSPRALENSIRRPGLGWQRTYLARRNEDIAGVLGAWDTGADLALCQVETPMTRTNGIPSPRPCSVNRASAAHPVRRAPRPQGRHRSSSSTCTGAMRMSPSPAASSSHWPASPPAHPTSPRSSASTCTPSSPSASSTASWSCSGEGNLISNQTSACCPAASQDGMIVLLTITVDSRGARVSFIRYVPVWVRHPDYVVLPAGTAWRTDPADAAALRASYERTVTVAGRGPQIQPIPACLP